MSHINNLKIKKKREITGCHGKEQVKQMKIYCNDSHVCD